MIGRLWGITIRVEVVLEILKLTKESKNNYYSLRKLEKSSNFTW